MELLGVGEIISSNINKFDYLAILRNNFSFEEKIENKDFFLGTISKEVQIKELNIKENDIQSSTKKIVEETQNEVIQEDIKEENEKSIIEDETSINVQTEVIQANNLPENYNTIYENVKIKNETDFNLSQDILKPDLDFLDKNNIIIFHTHTCESYTQTEKNKYNPSRKLQNNRFELLCCQSRKCIR